jgi:site-specific recombinase XerC
MTPAEVTAIIGQCSRRAPTGIRNRALLTLLYRSGLRVSEILAVRPSDVDMARHSIRLLDTKSGQPQTRGFHPSADDALARWLDTRQALGTGPGKLFCTLAGTPLSDDYVRGLLHRLGAKAGIPKRVHPHGPAAHVRRRAGDRRDTGHRDQQAPRAFQRGRHGPLPRSPDQRAGRHGAGGRRLAAAVDQPGQPRARN